MLSKKERKENLRKERRTDGRKENKAGNATGAGYPGLRIELDGEKSQRGQLEKLAVHI